MNTTELWLWKKIEVVFQTLNAQEAFMIWMKAGVVTGVALASPWIFYQIWHFVAAGLYRHEKGYVYIYLPFSLGCSSPVPRWRSSSCSSPCSASCSASKRK